MAQQAPISKKTTSAKQTSAARAAATTMAAKQQTKQGLDQEERHRMITETAYLIAEKRGFEGDRALDDWLQAEAKIDARYAARH